ncbi:hypothetical protein QBC47DRAFT_361954 [Echria macrotheca]|uniref:Uncharacterized protein n=1 Tax=Echria macrotheca TaxID=438768 RepID=A0AAJ0FA83_9PEZI|nr:hypothetical protein QBC47DRAFT_361954 [Echria macrotheca]
MRLLHTNTHELAEFADGDVPRYAILSHTWDRDEVALRDIAELSEAINSMYRWYQDADSCLAYLADVPCQSFLESRWFTRGWTLQVPIAPSIGTFFRCVRGTRIGGCTARWWIE